MKASIAFIIYRMNCYRILGAAIDAALKRGWHVECWHNIENPDVRKGPSFPNKDMVPVFLHGQVTIREYHGHSQLSQWICKKAVDVVVNNVPPIGLRQGDWPPQNERSHYVLLSAFSGEWYFYVSDPEELKQIDLIALHTPYWQNFDMNFMKEICKIPFSHELEDNIRQKTVIVGMTELDQLSLINPEEVKREWGIPLDRPIVTYMNFPNKGKYTARLQSHLATSWKNKMCALIKLPSKIRVAKTMLREPDHKDILKSIRSFCDHNNAFWILKCRDKDTPSKDELKMADKILFDEAYYPHTILKLMSIADLCISYFSLSLLEASAAGVFHLSLDVGGVVDPCNYGEKGLSYHRRLSRPGEFFNFPGVSSVLKEDQIIKTLPSRRLDEFKIKASAHREFYAKYLGRMDESHSDRFLDGVQSLIDSNKPKGQSSRPLRRG